LQQVGVDELYCVATDSTNNASYEIAEDKLDQVSVQYVSALKDTTTVQDYNIDKATMNSTDTAQKERYAVGGIDNTYRTVSAAFISRLQSPNNNKRCIWVVPSGNKIYFDLWQNSDGSWTENKEVNNQFLAAIMAGLYVTADDPATSVMGKVVPGINFGTDSGNWNDAVERGKIQSYGGTYILNKNGTAVVWNDNTNDTTIAENFSRPVSSGEDEMRRRLRVSTERFLGKKNTEGTRLAIKSDVEDELKKMNGEFIIDGYQNLVVAKDSQTPTLVNVTFEYMPVYPIEDIFITYSFQVQTTA
jgi:protein involved in ribonucleotide reduction